MEPNELLKRLSQTLDRLKIRYLVTGSMATIAFGEPRFTNDIDVVIDVSSVVHVTVAGSIGTATMKK